MKDFPTLKDVKAPKFTKKMVEQPMDLKGLEREVLSKKRSTKGLIPNIKMKF